MTNYKLTDFAITEVFKLLAPLNDSESEWFLNLDFETFKNEKETDNDKKFYIVINSLGINANVMQKSYLNVNCHAPDIKMGVPDQVSLNLMAGKVLGILQKITIKVGADHLLIDFEGSEQIPEKSLSEHYINLRFSVKIVNKN